MRVPLGVVGIISPWNYPLSIPFGEIVMGLMAGNTIILKVAAAAPAVGRAIENIIAAGELPEGLFHHVVGSGAKVATGMFDNGVNKLFFTGSVPAGKTLMAQAAETLTQLSLELGGNDPMIVLEDADLSAPPTGPPGQAFRMPGRAVAALSASMWWMRSMMSLSTCSRARPDNFAMVWAARALTWILAV